MATFSCLFSILNAITIKPMALRDKAVTQAPYTCARNLSRVSFRPSVEMNCFGAFEISSCSRHGEPKFIPECSFTLLLLIGMKIVGFHL